MRVIWPTRGIKEKDGLVLGWKIGDGVVVVAGVTHSSVWNNIEEHWKDDGELAGLVILGRSISDGEAQTTEKNECLTFWVDNNYLPISCSQKITLVIYRPPDTRRLQYLTLRPGKSSGNCNESLGIQDGYGISAKLGLGEEQDVLRNVLSRINQTKGVQILISRLQQEKVIAPPKISSNSTLREPHARLQTPILPNPFSLACVDQINRRFKQLIAISRWFMRSGVAESVAERGEEYNTFCNTVWLVLNDLLLGYVVYALILKHASALSSFLSTSSFVYLIRVPALGLQWLNDWPVGLKLNTPLSQFFCTAFGMIVQDWGDLVGPQLEVFSDTVIRVIAYSSLTGFTSTLCILQEFLTLLTLHLLLSYKIMSGVFIWQVGSLDGLWKLFRGKRWNVLRQRTDAYDYDLDQLFLGTLLFTVSAFLFPTVLAYYAFFGMIRISVLVIEQVLEQARRAFNECPLFDIMLRVREPSRLPAGLSISYRGLSITDSEIRETEGRIRIRGALVLESSPKSIGEILFP